MVADRKSVDWKAMAEEFYNLVKDTTDETAVRVEVTNFSGVDNGIDIYPADTNTTNCFYQTEEIVDFCRCKGLSNHVSVVDGICVARIY